MYYSMSSSSERIILRGCRCIGVVILVLVGSYSVYSQKVNEAKIERGRKEPLSTYLNMSFGMNFSKFRDFATSPLFYAGKPLYFSMSHTDFNALRESDITASYSFGKYKTDFNEHYTESRVNTVMLSYRELFQVKRIRTERLNVKIGGEFNVTANHRENEALFNNSEGVEVMASLFGSLRASLDVSRNEEKERKWLFMKVHAKKRKRALTYLLNVGLVNASYRNGFAYTNPSAPLNKDEFFAGYTLNAFSGFRLRTALDYTVYLQNNNAIQLSYIWDAYKTGGQDDHFEMAVHILKVSLLFGLK